METKEELERFNMHRERIYKLEMRAFFLHRARSMIIIVIRRYVHPQNCQ